VLKTGKIAIIFILGLFASTGHLFSQNDKIMHPAPVVNFEMTGNCFGDTTYFTNTSQLGVYYTWVIYKQGTSGWDTLYKSKDFNIKFLFPYKGVFQVELDGDNGHYVTLSRIIIIDSVPHSNSDYQACQSQFVNLSCCYNSCWWDFGDGHTSTATSPIHFYDTLGTYTVKLAVTKGNVTDTSVNDIKVQTLNTMQGTFTYRVKNYVTTVQDTINYPTMNNILNGFTEIVNNPVYTDTVFFSANDTIYGPFTFYHWAFGDGSTVDLTSIGGGKRVWHTYSRKDTTYAAFLLVKTSCISAYSQKNIFIPDNTPPPVGTTIYPNPVANEMLHVVTDRKADWGGVSITDYLGRSVSGWNLIERHKGYDLDLSALPQAVYLVRFIFGEDVILKKIIKQ
jgi:PKD repeat protein